jgi:A/G-specific adenine glycosylase
MLWSALGEWFERERRALPWRATRDPYAIWISEAMLQQTRVETALPYYERFLARFPDVRTLAAAEEDEVLAQWSGLGYYGRARALRAAARLVVGELGGRFPSTRAGWLALPGVGPYTAGAVLSIAFGLREPLVDGNVQRVFARLFAVEGAQGSKELAERCWELARALVPSTQDGLRPGDWNQALMELGARLCTAAAPRCEVCPLRSTCRARILGKVEEFPGPRARKAGQVVRLEILVASRGDELVLVQRAAGGRMAGLLEFPTRELVRGRTAARLWPARHLSGLAPAPGRALGELTHTITHHRIHARVRPGRCECALAPPLRSCPPEQLSGLALTGLARKVLARLLSLTGALR